jgi:hypothetical protein
VLDVDGVLTDGGLWTTESGEVLKRFDVRDGLGNGRNIPEGCEDLAVRALFPRNVVHSPVGRACLDDEVAAVAREAQVGDGAATVVERDNTTSPLCWPLVERHEDCALDREFGKGGHPGG